ncbi:dcp2 [Symbiodinium sp. KB8]|nr:dcp2 [Symbiodinium sp. KB8]
MAEEFEAEVPLDVNEALADLSVRFLINLPDDEPPSADRLFMQVQQAHWFYEDFYVDQLEHVPHLRAREFTKLLFERNPVLQAYKERHAQYFQEFKDYIKSIPVYGTVLFTESCEGMVLCKSWSGKCWNAPRGKLNAGESPAQCAARETAEETGFDPTPLIDEKVYVEWMNGDQLVRLYVVVGAPQDFAYAPTTRKEVSEVRRWDTKAVLRRPKNKRRPGVQRFWPMFPILEWLREFVKAGGKMPTRVPRRAGRRRGAATGHASGARAAAQEEARAGRAADMHNAATFGSEDEGESGWTVDDMFSANSKLTGLDYTYDGSAAEFGGPTLVYHADAVAARHSGATQPNSAGVPQPQPSPPAAPTPIHGVPVPSTLPVPAPHSQLPFPNVTGFVQPPPARGVGRSGSTSSAAALLAHMRGGARAQGPAGQSPKELLASVLQSPPTGTPPGTLPSQPASGAAPRRTGAALLHRLRGQGEQ